MAKIVDVVKLKTGYANFVELESSFEKRGRLRPVMGTSNRTARP